MQDQTPRAPARARDTSGPTMSLGFERLLLSLRLGFLLVPLLLVAAYGWSATRSVVQVDVVVALECALVWVLLGRYPTLVLRWQLALRLVDVAVVYVVSRFVPTLVGNALYDSLYVTLIVAAAVTHGRRGTYWAAATATLAVFLGHMQPTLDGILQLHSWNIAESVFYALLFVSTGTITSWVRNRTEEVAPRDALRDPLTALPTPTLFEDRLQQALLAAHRTNMPLTILRLELNQFHTIAERFGDRGGDLVLQHVARRLQERLRGVDTVARLDRDTFVILLPRTDEMGAIRAAKKVGAWLGRPLVVEGRQVELEARIGISSYPHHGTQPALLLERATRAMNVARWTGRGYAVYDPKQEPIDLQGLVPEAIEA